MKSLQPIGLIVQFIRHQFILETGLAPLCAGSRVDPAMQDTLRAVFFDVVQWRRAPHGNLLCIHCIYVRIIRVSKPGLLRRFVHFYGNRRQQSRSHMDTVMGKIAYKRITRFLFKKAAEIGLADIGIPQRPSPHTPARSGRVHIPLPA